MFMCGNAADVPGTSNGCPSNVSHWVSIVTTADDVKFGSVYFFMLYVFQIIDMISSLDKTFAKPLLIIFNSFSCISGSSVNVTSLPKITLKLRS